MPILAYLLGLTLGGATFWLLWKLLRSLRRRGRWGYYLAAAWAGAVGGLLFIGAFYLTGQGEVLFDRSSRMTAGEIIRAGIIVGALLGLGMAWRARLLPSPLNDVDTDAGPWTPELVKEVLADAEGATPERRRQIAEQLRQMARDSKVLLPEELEGQVVRWELEAASGPPDQVERRHG